MSGGASAHEGATADAGERRDAALLVCMFHLNLAFSSLAPDRQAHVVQCCYWPMLRLAEETPFPIAFEATGWTLERIAEHDPAWIARARELIEAGRVELVGSAYAQCAAPLLPAAVNRWNLRLGLEVYERLLGVRPALALVCEQAYSPGLVPLYADAGVEAMIVDWDNAYRSNLDWGADVRRQPQRALGSDGVSLPIVWSESIAFQKFQRYAHDELSLERYVAFIADAVAEGRGALMLYANDAEIFDHRPGRFAAEPALGQGEWERVARALRTLGERGDRDAGAAARRARAARPPRRRARAAPRGARPADPGQEAGQVQHHALGRDAGATTSASTRAASASTSACGRPRSRTRRRGGASASCGRRTTARTSPTTAGRRCSSSSRVRRPTPACAPVAPAPTAAAHGAAPAPPQPPAEVTRDGSLWHVRSGHLAVTLNARRGLVIEAFRDRPPRSRHALRHARARLLSVDRARRRLVHRRRRAGGAAAPQGHRPRADATGLRTRGGRRDPRLRAPDDGARRRREADRDRRRGGHGDDRHDAALARAAAGLAACRASRAAPRGLRRRQPLLRDAQRRRRARAPRARRAARRSTTAGRCRRSSPAARGSARRTACCCSATARGSCACRST